MNITKAIIPIAGWGTRRLPITKSIEKYMLPIGNRPVIDYVVDDCIKAGITDIYFVIREQNNQLRSYYEPNVELNEYLRKTGKTDYIKLITPPKIRMHYIEQIKNGKSGSAIPVSQLSSLIQKDESVLVVMGDDCIYRKDGLSDLGRLIKVANGNSAILGTVVDHKDVSKYGVLEINNNNELVSITEKPQPDESPSDMVNVSKYVLNHDLLQMVDQYVKSVTTSEEYYITDPINQYISSGGTMKVVMAEGIYLDVGTVESWLKANQIVVGDTSI